MILLGLACQPNSDEILKKGCLTFSLRTDNKSMMLIEFVAAMMLLAISLTLGGVALNRLLQQLVEASFAKMARVEAQDLDEKFRRMNGHLD